MEAIVNNKASRQRQSRSKTMTGQENLERNTSKLLRSRGRQNDSFVVSDLVSLQLKSLKKPQKVKRCLQEVGSPKRAYRGRHVTELVELIVFI